MDEESKAALRLYDQDGTEDIGSIESAERESTEETKRDTVGGELVQKVASVEGWLKSLRPGYCYLYKQAFADAGLDSVAQVKGLSSGDITRLVARLGGATGSKPLHIRVVQRAIAALAVAPRTMDDPQTEGTLTIDRDGKKLESRGEPDIEDRNRFVPPLVLMCKASPLTATALNTHSTIITC
jgi:hypothetical protein